MNNKTHIFKFSVLLYFFFCISNIVSQTKPNQFNIPQKKAFYSDSLQGFDEQYIVATARKNGLLETEMPIFLEHLKREYINNRYGIKESQGQWPAYSYKPIGNGGQPQILTPACNNEDFEMANISGWTDSKGSNSNSQTMAGCCPVAGANYSMVPSTAFDPLTSISLASPLGGGWAVRLGDLCTPGEVNRLSKTFAVTSANALFQVAYFAVFEDAASHPCNATPYVNISMLNCSNVQLACPSVSVTAPSSGGSGGCTSTTAGWTTGTFLSFPTFTYVSSYSYSTPTYSTFTTYTAGGYYSYYGYYYYSPYTYTVGSGTPTYVTTTYTYNSSCYPPTSGSWSGWKVASLDLTPYIGTCVTIQLTAAGCAYGGHRGYAYFDTQCTPMNVTVNGNLFPAGTPAFTVSACGAASGSMSAPVGLGPYNWQGPAGSGINNNTNQTITTSTSGNYTLTMTPPGSCAPITKTVTLLFTAFPTSGFTSANSCNNYTFTNTGSAAPSIQTYSFVGSSAPPSFTTTSTTSSMVTFPTATTYTVIHVLTNTAGCTSTTQAVINVPSSPNVNFAVPSATQCLTGNSFNFNASSAVGVHSYSFNPVAGSPAVGGTSNYIGSFSSAGTYTVTHSVTNAGCTNFSTSVVVVNPMPSLTGLPTNASCGNSNGSIVINNTSAAGQTAVSFSVNGTAIPSQTATGLAAGTYVIGMTNNFGCTYTTNVVVANTPGITALATTFTNAACGNTNGSIALGLVTGGTPTYSFNVNGGAYTTSPALTSLAAGTYTIGVKDPNNCVFTKTVTLSNSSAPTGITFTTSPTACVGNTGVLGITGVTGGTAAYTFSLNGVTTGSVTNSLASGPKTLTVKDANGCTYSTTANIPTVSGPTSGIVAVSNAACGNPNGTATVTSVSGGLPAYQYSFNGGALSSSTIQGGMLAGPKSVVIVDANSCSLTVNFIIGNTGSPVSAVATLSNVSCFGGNNGTFSISTSAGSPGYSYTLTPGNALSGTGQFTGLTAQAYTVNVQDALGCVTTVTTNITQPSALTLLVNSTAPSCFGGTNGTITATAGGGTLPYLYNLNAGPNQASNVFTTAISAGAYNLTVIDNKGCILSQTVSVSQPPVLAVALSSTNSNCSALNGIASVTATGGTPIYTYSWMPSGGTGAQTSGVLAGTYTVTVKDIKNCTQTGVVTVNASLSGTATITGITNVSCFGGNNGSATANMVGGTAPLTYTWSAPVSSALQTVNGLLPGTYTVQVSDFYGCKSSTVATITQPAFLNVTAAGSPAACFNTATGSATATVVSGGTAGFSYLWTPSGISTSVATGLTAGNYSCQVTDANGCISIQTISITQPSSVTITTSTITAACNQSNGAVSSTVTGGTAPYTYTWSTGSNATNLTGIPAGTYTIQVKDNNNCIYVLAATVPNASGPSLSIISQTNVSCNGGNDGIAVAQITGGTPGPGFPIYNWSNGQNTGTATNLLQGVYTATVTDAAGCIASVSVTISQPLTLTVNVSGTNPKCFNATNGTANAGVAGGTGPYNYAWLPAPGAGGTTSTPSGMGPGNYIVTVTDSKGCIKQGSVALANPALMLASVSSTNLTCFNANNGMAIATTTNAVGAVAYYYTGGPLPLTTQTVSGLIATTYTMLATDQNSCTASVVFTITQPPVLTVGISATGSVSCSGGNNGFATATPNGGTPAYNYLWSNAQTSATSNNLTAGGYTVTVTDSKGCTATANTSILQPLGLTAIVTGTNVTCNGLNNGIGNVNYAGGSGIPAILWQPGLQVVQTPTNLVAPQIHTVTLTDANGCILTKTLNITQPTALTSTLVNVVSTNCNQSNGSASVAVSGGAGGYTYQWTSNPAFTNNNITNVVAGPYTITVTDANGCQSSQIAAINNIAGPSINALTSSSVICFGQTNGTASVSASGGVGTLTYLWSYLSQTVSAVNNLPNGLHSVTVKDAANCITVGTVTIVQPTQVVSAIGGFTNVSCSGASNGMALVLSNGGNTPYTYSWTPTGNISATLTNANPGTYTVLVKDVNNCPTTSTVTITTPNPLLITTNTVTNVNCNGGNNGIINTSITGGTPTYTLTWSPVQPANPLITNLAAGTYSLGIVDTKGCATNSVYTINQPSALSIVSSNTTAATCGNANGTANVIITGGTSPYNYSWNTPTPQLSNTASNLAPANWVLTSTDNKGCIIQATVTIPAPALPTVVSAFTTPNCFGQTTGSASLTASGVAPFNYNWSPSGLTTATISGIGAALYSATVTDANGCKTYTTANVTQPSILLLNQSPVQTICYGTNANVYGQGSGGTIPYTYTLTDLTSGVSNTATTSNGITSVNTLTTTTQYTIAIIDANGCSNGPNTIIVNVTPQLLASGTSFTICDNKKVVLTPNITSVGNGGPYTYNWSNTATVANNTVTANYNSNPNTYSVLVSDGCTIPNAVAYFTVNVNPAPQFKFMPDTVKGCAPLFVNFQATSTSTSYNAANDSYLWFLGGDNSFSGSSVANTYTTGVYGIQVVATNSFGCTKKIIANNIIEAYAPPIAAFYANPLSTTIFNPLISFTNQSIGANSYFWDFGNIGAANNTSNATNPSYTYPLVGNYDVYLVAKNSKGCSDTAKYVIEIAPDFGVYIPNAFTPDENNLNDTFQPKGYGINEDKYKMEIFDRWGELIFTSNTFNKGWDGRAKGSSQVAQDGVYIYKIFITDLQGNKKNYVGHITLIKQ